MRQMLVISLLMLSACGKFYVPKDPRTIHGVNPIFQPYIDLYVQQKGSKLAYDIPMQFTDLKGDTVGLCTRWHESGYRQIQIDRSYWNYISDNMRIALISHELGHCDLNRNHDETIISYQMPKSFMYPSNFDYPDSWIFYYFSELFNPNAIVTHFKPTSHDDDCVHDLEVE